MKKLELVSAYVSLQRLHLDRQTAPVAVASENRDVPEAKRPSSSSNRTVRSNWLPGRRSSIDAIV